MKRGLKLARHIFRDGVTACEALAIAPTAIGVELAVPMTEGASAEASGDERVSVIRVQGAMEHHASWLWTSYDEIRETALAELAKGSVEALVLRFDTVGGVVSGCGETARAIQDAAAAAGKSVYGFIDETCLSAGYWLATACSKIWMPISGQCGSIGTIVKVVSAARAMKAGGLDVAIITSGARKGDGMAERELSDEIVASFQEKVDYLADLFYDQVAQARGLTPESVKAFEAGIFLGSTALDLGLVDGIGSWEEFFSTVRGSLDSNAAQAAPQVANTPRSRHEKAWATRRRTTAQAIKGRSIMKLQALLKAKADAAAALAKATTAEARASALAEFEAASISIHQLMAAAGPSQKPAAPPAAEVDAECECEDEAEDAEAEEDEESDAEAEDESEPAEDEESEDEDKEEDEVEEKAIAKAFASGKAGSIYSPSRMLRLARQVTGVKGGSVREVFGALEGLGKRLSSADAVKGRVAKLEQQSRAQRVDGMLAKAKAAGKISPPEMASLRAKGMSDPKWLKGHLGVLPKRIRTVAEGEELVARTDSDGNPVGGMSVEQQGLFEKACAGLSPEERAKMAGEFTKTQAKAANGASRRF